MLTRHICLEQLVKVGMFSLYFTEPESVAVDKLASMQPGSQHHLRDIKTLKPAATGRFHSQKRMELNCNAGAVMGGSKTIIYDMITCHRFFCMTSHP